MWLGLRKKSDQPQIDADWLLGPSDGPSRSYTAPMAWLLLLVFGIGGGVYSWPTLSKNWLQWEWTKRLAQADVKSADDVLPILVALQDLNPNQFDAVVRELANPNRERRQLAFQLLNQRVDQWLESKKTKANEVEQLGRSLQSVSTEIQETVLFRAQLAAKLLQLPDMEGSSFRIKPLLEQQVAEAARFLPPRPSAIASPPAPIVTVSAPIPSATTAIVTSTRSEQEAEPHVSRNSTRVASKISDVSHVPSKASEEKESKESTLTQIASKDPSDSVPPVPALKSRASGKITMVAHSIPIEVLEPTTSPSPKQMDSATQSNTGWKQESTQPAETAAFVVRDSGLIPASSLQPAPAPERWRPTLEKQSDAPKQEDAVTPSIRGIEKLSMEMLLPLLASTQPKISQQATMELMRRGMSKKQLQIASALAHGDVDARLRGMDHLVREPSFDAVPWLIWMAEHSDAKVRRKAISLLGSMSSDEALRKLRLLKQREPDSAIVDQINQVLLAAGSANSGRLR